MARPSSSAQTAARETNDAQPIAEIVIGHEERQGRNYFAVIRALTGAIKEALLGAPEEGDLVVTITRRQ